MVYVVEMSAEEFAVHKVAISESISSIKDLIRKSPNTMFISAFKKELSILETLIDKEPEIVGGVYID